MRIGRCIALSVALVVLSSLSTRAQSGYIPQGISYQGYVESNGHALSGTHTIIVTYYTAGSGGTMLSQETFHTVTFLNGVFNIILGQSTPGDGFPASMDFSQQYWLEITVDTTTLLPRTAMWTVPYAMNTNEIGNLKVSATPVNGRLWPVPIDAQGKIDASMLPNQAITINGVSANNSSNINLTGSNGITITPNPAFNTITISGPPSLSSFSQLSVTGNSTLGSGTSTIALLGTTTATAANTSAALSVASTESNGGSSLMVKGGMGANNPTGAADGTGLTAGSPQTFWCDQVAVPTATGNSITIFNALVSATSTIIVTPVCTNAGNATPVAVTGVGAGQFTVTSYSTLGTSAGGTVSAINYLVVNH